MTPAASSHDSKHVNDEASDHRGFPRCLRPVGTFDSGTDDWWPWLPGSPESDDQHMTDTQVPRSVDSSLMVDELVVPLDGSAFARRAVGPASLVARRLGASVTFVTVVPRLGDALGNDLSEVEGLRHGEAAAPLQVLIGDDAGATIGSFAEQAAGRLVCMTTHGRSWPASALIGSAAALVVARSDRPLLAVGPNCAAGWTPDGPVVACVDGRRASESAISHAATWATALGVDLVVVTVAEPVPPLLPPADLPGAHRRGLHGSGENVDDYIERVVAQVSAPDVHVAGHVIWDPVGVASGLRTLMENHRGGILVVADHGRSARPDTPLGQTALRILHQSPVPVLVVAPLEGDSVETTAGRSERSR